MGFFEWVGTVGSATMSAVAAGVLLFAALQFAGARWGQYWSPWVWIGVTAVLIVAVIVPDLLDLTKVDDYRTFERVLSPAAIWLKIKTKLVAGIAVHLIAYIATERYRKHW